MEFLKDDVGFEKIIFGDGASNWMESHDLWDETNPLSHPLQLFMETCLFYDDITFRGDFSLTR